MALFLFACQPKSTRSPTNATQIRSDAFSVAEKYRQKGDLAQSLTYYQSFLTQAVKDDRIPLALQRVAEIELKLNNPENALASLERLSRRYPDYTWIPEVRYQISLILNQLGRYEASAATAIGWLDQYQGPFLKKDVLVLLGDDFCAMGETESAFFCWIEAKDVGKDDEEKETALDEKLKTLIHTSRPLFLSRLLENEREAFYPPGIYYQISSAFLSQKEPERAERAAQILMESTRNLQWIKRRGRPPGSDQRRNGHLRKLHRLSAPFEWFVRRLWSGSPQWFNVGNDERSHERNKDEGHCQGHCGKS